MVAAPNPKPALKTPESATSVGIRTTRDNNPKQPRFPLTDGGHMEILSIIGTIVFVAVVALSLLAVLDIFFKSDKKKMRKRNAATRKLKHERPTWSRK
jgi:hypothetical protein